MQGRAARDAGKSEMTEEELIYQFCEAYAEVERERLLGLLRRSNEDEALEMTVSSAPEFTRDFDPDDRPSAGYLSALVRRKCVFLGCDRYWGVSIGHGQQVYTAGIKFGGVHWTNAADGDWG